MNFTDVEKVLADLNGTPEGEKNFFGRYKHEVGQEWNLLNKLYC